MSAAQTTTTRTLHGTGSSPTVAEMTEAIAGCPSNARVDLRVSDSYRGSSSWTLTIRWSGAIAAPATSPLAWRDR